MTNPSNQQIHADVRLGDRSPGARDDPLTIDRAWLPMDVWEDVLVRTRSTRGLTIMERFVIECLICLDGCSAADLTEIAAIPPELGTWLLSSCTERSLARREGDVFYADESACERALQQGRVPCESEERLDFLCFPETDEFVLLGDSGQFLRELRRVLPSGQFPLSERWKRAERRVLLTQALDEGRVYGKGIGACVEFLDETCAEKELCPAYYANVELGDDSDTDWKLSIVGKRKRKRGTVPASSPDSDDFADIVNVPITLPVLKHARGRWEATCAAAEDAVRDTLCSIGLQKIDRRSSFWKAQVDAATAEKMAAERPLSSDMEIEVQIDGEIKFSMRLELSPCDEGSRKGFARDDVVRAVLAAPEGCLDFAVIGEGCATMAEVRSRLWQLRLFGKVYELRKKEDFGE